MRDRDNTCTHMQTTHTHTHTKDRWLETLTYRRVPVCQCLHFTHQSVAQELCLSRRNLFAKENKDWMWFSVPLDGSKPSDSLRGAHSLEGKDLLAVWVVSSRAQSLSGSSYKHRASVLSVTLTVPPGSLLPIFTSEVKARTSSEW